MPTYDTTSNDGFFYWTPSSSRSERVEPVERVVQSIAESSPLDDSVDALLCNLATLNQCTLTAVSRA